MNVRVCLVREVEVDICFEITCVILFLFLLIHSSDVSGSDLASKFKNSKPQALFAELFALPLKYLPPNERDLWTTSSSSSFPLPWFAVWWWRVVVVMA